MDSASSKLTTSSGTPAAHLRMHAMLNGTVTCASHSSRSGKRVRTPLRAIDALKMFTAPPVADKSFMVDVQVNDDRARWSAHCSQPFSCERIALAPKDLRPPTYPGSMGCTLLRVPDFLSTQSGQARRRLTKLVTAAVAILRPTDARSAAAHGVTCMQKTGKHERANRKTRRARSCSKAARPVSVFAHGRARCRGCHRPPVVKLHTARPLAASACGAICSATARASPHAVAQPRPPPQS